MERQDFADEGLAGGGDGRDKEIAAAHNLVSLEGLLLEGQKVVAIFPFQDIDDLEFQSEGFQQVDAHGVMALSIECGRENRPPIMVLVWERAFSRRTG